MGKRLLVHAHSHCWGVLMQLSVLAGACLELINS